MAKNIVLCSDGTGNQGGTTPDTNVFKIYNAVKINNKNKGTEQITYYDNGVGTSKISIMQALGGGMGWGFKQNVRDLYEFLGRNYREAEKEEEEKGDDIYIFGFSRGAATVRAFAGMIEHCGLVVKHRIKKSDRSEEEFQDLIDEAMECYEKGKLTKEKDGRIIERNYKEADDFRKENAYEHATYAPDGRLKIEFMGIWDTVSSLGVPQLGNFDKLVNKKIPHLFYDYEPWTCVKNVYHAIAVDDERLTFSPMVWDETNFNDEGTIEQVWFPGMHSNVGGGYNRQELATVTLDWMMKKLSDHMKSDKPPRNGGLVLKEVAEESAENDTNPFGKLHDSRSGFGIFYRYQPRNIKKLCDGRLKEKKIKIHNSVFKRIKFSTGRYAPLNIPNPEDFEVVYTRNRDDSKTKEEEQSTQNPQKDKTDETNNYADLRGKIVPLIEKRKDLYWLFLKSIIFLVIVSFIVWIGPIDWKWWLELKKGFTTWFGNLINSNWWLDLLIGFIYWSLEHIAEILNYFLPDFFEGIITLGVINHPLLLLGLIIYSKYLWSCRSNILNKMGGLQEEARVELLKLMNK